MYHVYLYTVDSIHTYIQIYTYIYNYMYNIYIYIQLYTYTYLKEYPPALNADIAAGVFQALCAPDTDDSVKATEEFQR